MLKTPAERCMCGFGEVRVSVLENGGPELNLKMKGDREREKGRVMQREDWRAETWGREEWSVL